MRSQAFFVGDQAALDFLNTIAAPHGDWIESIGTGEAYVSWLADVGLLAPSETKELLDGLGRPALNRVASEARGLREWFRLAVETAVTETKWPVADIAEKLNQLLLMGGYRRQLERSDGHLALTEKHEYTRARQLLVPVAQVIAELVTEYNLSLIKRCANPPCTLWFYDRTKAHRRRFCSAAVCGNRVKVAAFRARQQ